MSRFIVFDVETPNSLNNRMSAIGITVIENGAIIDEFYSLVNPETRFDAFNVQLTGISGKMVRNAPTFPELWPAIEPVMSDGLLVAHNAVFDLSVLKSCLRDYGIDWKPYVRYVCTVQTGRRVLPGMSHRLNVLCDYYGINLNHHHAASDSHACAEILLRYIKDGADMRQHIRTFSFREVLCTIYGIRGTAAKSAAKGAGTVICTTSILFGTRTARRFTKRRRAFNIRFPKTGAVSTRSRAEKCCASA